MMKVFVFIAVATFLVVDTSATLASVEERESWIPQCNNETGFVASSTPGPDVTDPKKTGCFAACLLDKAGVIKDGKLAEREKVLADLVEEWTLGLGARGLQPKEGRTFHQLAEKCYDEANAKTEKCEIGGAVGMCLIEGMEKPAANSDNISEDSNSSEE